MFPTDWQPCRSREVVSEVVQYPCQGPSDQVTGWSIAVADVPTMCHPCRD